MLLSNQIFRTITVFILSSVMFKSKASSITFKSSPQEKLNDIGCIYNLLDKRDTIYASTFGVKADYDGQIGSDNRYALQQAIDYCSIQKKILKLPSGKILVNSYATGSAAKAHGNILTLKSNLHIIGNKSEIIIGSFFHDKNFIVFSGLNTANPNDITSLTNILITRLAINFNASKSFMKTKYLLRKGIEIGRTINGEISFCTFYNGDISCGIATGYGNEKISNNIKIHNNVFQNLSSSTKNLDHTSIYLNSTNSTIFKNKFTNTLLQGKLISCAAELHNSNTAFVDNTVSGYTRMMFLAVTLSEHLKISNLVISNNVANITNAAIYLWLDKGASMDGISVENNSIVSTHVSGYSELYNGTQGMLADARDEKGTMISNMVLRNNKTTIKRTLFKGRAVNYSTKYKFKSINNSCIGCADGLFYK